MIPGLVNTHHHFYQTLTRAHPAGMNADLVPWLVALYPIWGRLSPAQLRLAVRMALIELLLSGCTTAADHHNLFPPGLENAIDIEVEEARALRLRMTVTRGAMSLSVKDGGLPPDDVVQDDETIFPDCERVLNLFHDPAARFETQIAFAPCSPFAVNQAPVGATAPSWPSDAIAGCTLICARSRTRSGSASRRTACARSTSWRRPAG